MNAATDAFTSADGLGRVLRTEVAQSLSEHLGRTISGEDPDLTDELCYAYVNLLSSCDGPAECWKEIAADEYDAHLLEPFSK